MGRTHAPKQAKDLTQEDSPAVEHGERASAGARQAFLDLQMTAGNQAVSQLLESGAAGVTPAGLEGIAISAPGSAQEQEAAHLEQQMAAGKESAMPAHMGEARSGAGQRSPIEDLLGSGEALGEGQRLHFTALLGADLEDVRVHTGTEASELADRLGAEALTLGHDIVLGGDQVADRGGTGGLLAHELTHVAQQQGATGVSASATTVFRETKGEESVDKAEGWLSPKDRLKAEVDVLHVALRDAQQNKAVGFNRQAGLKRVENATRILGANPAQAASLKSDWEWLIDNHKSAGTPAYRARKNAFFSALRSPLAQLEESYVGSHAENLLRNTPPQVLDIIDTVADATVPPVQLYTYASIEGLLDAYVRPQLKLAGTAFPTKAQLATVRTDKPLSGFDALGLDDFMTEMNAPREPLKGFLPKDFDPKKVKEIKRTNEKGREVHSGEFADVRTALQGMLAMLKRRRTLFEQDAQATGYATPSEEELVYWTYVYFNAGEFAGKAQLQKFKGKRKLGDWIASKEFPNAIKLLQTYKMLKAMKLF